jgi:DNA replication and repair protein RecF
LRISNLKLNNFRNYISEEFLFGEGINVIFGGNAQGKTNVLESIYLCSCGRSHRTSKDQEMIRFGSQGYRVYVEVESSGLNPSVEISIKKGEKKKIMINGVPVKRIGELLGNVRTVMFSPEEMSIVKGPPSARRRFIDISLSQIKPSYFYDLQKYGRILKQRNNLLREIREKEKNRTTLDVWSEALADTGARIIERRIEITGKISKIAEEKQEAITRGQDKLKIGYSPSFKIENRREKEEIKEEFLREIEKNYEKEIFYGVTLLGPHRDDWTISQGAMDIKEYGSQGQQRTAVLAIKLAEMKIIEEETGEMPVLLLDDVMSELDAKRREYLLKSVEGMQVLITATERDAIKGGMGNINYIEIRDGKRV